MDYQALKDEINLVFPNLSPQVQTAARFLLDHAEDVALLSMRQLAKSAGVHPTTMVRLAQTLGFEGYNDLRMVFQSRMRTAPDDYVARAKGLQKHNGQLTDLIGDISRTANHNIHQSLHGVDAHKIEKAAEFILSARRVYVMGLRISYPVAFSFFYAYGMFKSNARLVDGRAGTVADVLRGVEKGDVVLAISVSPFSRETVRAVDYVRKRGASVVTISDSEITPISKAGDHALLVKNESPTLFPSMIASMALVETLIAIMISKGGQELLDAVAQSKSQLDQFDAYWESAE